MSAPPRRPGATVDPELRRQLAEAPGARRGAIEAVLRLRAPVRRGRRSAAPEAAHETARELLARVADEVGAAPSDYDFNVLPNLGYCVLRAPADFVERVLQQPEVASASANRRD